MAKIQTVNVVVKVGGNLMEVHSFIDDADGNSEANKLFIEFITERATNIDEYTDQDFENLLDNGYEAVGDFEFFVVHSE